MALEYMPLSAIARAERNPKQHDEAGIRAAIGKWGVADLPVLDERTGRLVSGHGRLDQVEYLSRLSPADLELATGKTRPPGGIQVDPVTGEWLLPVVRGWASETDADAEAYLIGANKLAMNGAWDDTELAQMLSELVGVDDELVRLAGIGAGELEGLLALLDPPAIVHESVPATGARYAETAEQEAKRNDRIAGYQPAVDRAGGFSEVILVYPNDDREEVGRLIVAARDVLGADLRAADVVLRALRVLAAVLDARLDPAPVSLAVLARHAGWAGE